MRKNREDKKNETQNVMKAIYYFRLYTILEALQNAKKGEVVDRRIVKQAVSLFKKLKKTCPEIEILSANAILDKEAKQCSALSLQLSIAQVLSQYKKTDNTTQEYA